MLYFEEKLLAHLKKYITVPIIILFFFANLASANPLRYIEVDIGMGSSGVDLYKIFGEDPEFKSNNDDIYYAFSGGLLFAISPKIIFGPELGYSTGPTEKIVAKSDTSQYYELTNSQFELLGTMRYMATEQFAIVAKFGAIKPTGEFKSDEDDLPDVEGIAPKLYIAGQYSLNATIGVSLFVSKVFGESATTMKKLNDITKKSGDYAILKTPDVMAYGLGLTIYF